jgi:hypothetical protein
MKRFSIREFTIQRALSTAGAMVSGGIGGAIRSVLVATVTKNTSQGNFVDHVVDQRLFRVLVDNPYFLGPILVAFALGFLGDRVWKTQSAIWVWLLPTIILVWNVLTWRSYTNRSNAADAWVNYFGSDCRGSECLYELLITAPFLYVGRIYARLGHEADPWSCAQQIRCLTRVCGE